MNEKIFILRQKKLIAIQHIKVNFILNLDFVQKFWINMLCLISCVYVTSKFQKARLPNQQIRKNFFLITCTILCTKILDQLQGQTTKKAALKLFPKNLTACFFESTTTVFPVYGVSAQYFIFTLFSLDTVKGSVRNTQ